LGVSYTDARFKKARYTADDFPGQGDGWKWSRYIPRSARWSGSASFSVNPGAWKFLLSAHYTGEMYIDHVPDGDGALMMIEKTDPYVLANMKITREFGSRFNIYCGVRNLFDYVQKKRDITDAAYFYAPIYGRIFYTGIGVDIK